MEQEGGRSVILVECVGVFYPFLIFLVGDNGVVVQEKGVSAGVAYITLLTPFLCRGEPLFPNTFRFTLGTLPFYHCLCCHAINLSNLVISTRSCALRVLSLVLRIASCFWVIQCRIWVGEAFFVPFSSCLTKINPRSNLFFPG